MEEGETYLAGIFASAGAIQERGGEKTSKRGSLSANSVPSRRLMREPYANTYLLSFHMD